MATINLLLSRADTVGKYYDYDPSKVAAVIFLGIFGILTLLHLYQMLRTSAWYLIPFCLGGVLEIIGYLARLKGAAETPNWTKGPYIIQVLGILLGPLLFAASIYMVLGRIILLTDGESHSIIRRKWLTAIFVCGDIFSFLVQAFGGALLASGTAKDAKKGKNIILVGLFAQILFFTLFLINSLIFMTRLRSRPTPKSQEVPWMKHLATLFIVAALILIRSVYRVTEYVQGEKGTLQLHEVYLYALDAALMALAMLIFSIVHPSEVKALHQGGKAAVFLSVRTVSKPVDGWRMSSVSLLPVNQGGYQGRGGYEGRGGEC
ncbi:RTA1-domain-containing protein [Lophium mytilinum]|uniref:RTA1-domain-containing protein n=1 Tax=Lophium mytilinum TaxID=390894 RepID=A0A6A6QKP2_9PEZI|nr:RTA1-domain-containing protein [Lophium mytilinum]